MRKLTKYMTGILFGTFVLGTTAFAAEVTPVSGVGFTTENTEVKTEASAAGALVLTKEQCPDNIGVAITGVTDNGFWEVDLGQEQKFYIEGAGLVNINGNQEQTTNVESAAQTVVNDNIPMDRLLALYDKYKRENEHLTSTEIQRQSREIYMIYMQAINKLINGTINVSYYSDNSLTGYAGGVDAAVGTYLREQYPNYTISYDLKTNRVKASQYRSDFNITWG